MGRSVTQPMNWKPTLLIIALTFAAFVAHIYLA